MDVDPTRDTYIVKIVKSEIVTPDAPQRQRFYVVRAHKSAELMVGDEVLIKPDSQSMHFKGMPDGVHIGMVSDVLGVIRAAGKAN